MSDFNVRSDSVDVEQIMEQIRVRIREKRGVDYTEQQLRELAAVKLEKFLDPRGVRSDLLLRFKERQPQYEKPLLPLYTFEDTTIYETHRGPLQWIRRMLQPILKLLFNPNPIIHAFHAQVEINRLNLEREEAQEKRRMEMETLYYEIIHNLVFELTRTGIEVKNLKMHVESLAGRLEFNERRARALESAVVYKPSGGDEPAEPARDPRQDVAQPPSPAPSRAASPQSSTPPFQAPPRAPSQAQLQPVAPGGLAPSGDAPPAPPPAPEGGRPEGGRPEGGRPEGGGRPDGGRPDGGRPAEGPGQRSRRRRRRRGRRSGPPASAIMGAPSGDSAALGPLGPDDQAGPLEPDGQAAPEGPDSQAAPPGPDGQAGASQADRPDTIGEFRTTSRTTESLPAEPPFSGDEDDSTGAGSDPDEP